MSMIPDRLTAIHTALVDLQRQRQFRKACEVACDTLGDTTLSHVERQWLLTKFGELTRRRAAEGTLKVAIQALRSVDLGSLWRDLLPRYYYELGYTYRLAGRHAEAYNYMRRSAAAAASPHDGDARSLEFVAARVQEILCLIAQQETLFSDDALEFASELAKLQEIAAQNGQYWGNRWKLNCWVHMLHIWLRARKQECSWNTLEEVVELHKRN